MRARLEGHGILDDIHGSVQDGTNSTTDGTGNDIVGDLSLLGVGLGQQGANLEDDTKVTSVPEDVAPQCALKTVVQSQDTLVLDCLLDDIQRTAVQSGRGLVLETNLDYLVLAACLGMCWHTAA